MRKACEAQLPPGCDNRLLAPAAADAIQMLDLLLGQIIDTRAEISVEIAGWAEVSIDCYLQIAPKHINKQAHFPMQLMRRELERQSADLDWLKAELVLDAKRVGLFRSRATGYGGSLTYG